MNAHKALKEARARWGGSGFVLESGGAYRVGVKQGKHMHVVGVGNTWAKAFSDADAHQKAMEEKHAAEEGSEAGSPEAA